MTKNSNLQMKIFCLLLWQVWVSVCDETQFTPLTLEKKPLKLLLTGQCEEFHPHPSQHSQLDLLKKFKELEII